MDQQAIPLITMKMEMAVALASVASAYGFVAPSSFTGQMVAPTTSSSSSIEMAFGRSPKKAPPAKGPVSKGGSFEGELGAQPPLGFYDPAGLLKNADQER